METEIIVGLFTLAGTLLGYLTNYGIERLKATNDKRNYISNVKFDVEIQVYKELSKSFCEMVREINTIIPIGLVSVPIFKDDEERIKYDMDLYNLAVEAIVSAQNCLRSNIPFISSELYDKYNELIKLCMQQSNVFSKRWNMSFMGITKKKANLI